MNPRNPTVMLFLGVALPRIAPDVWAVIDVASRGEQKSRPLAETRGGKGPRVA